jgi:hypothetical protein
VQVGLMQEDLVQAGLVQGGSVCSGMLNGWIHGTDSRP